MEEHMPVIKMKILLSIYVILIFTLSMFYAMISSNTISNNQSGFNQVINATTVHKTRNEATKNPVEELQVKGKKLLPSLCRKKFFETRSARMPTKLTKRDIPLKDICSKSSSCEYNEKMDVPNCYCDTACLEFKDCCYGFYGHNASTEFSDIILYKDYIECRLDIIPGRSSYTKGYWMVMKYPENYKIDAVSIRCGNTTKEDIPVTDEKGIVYGNVYCARCHGAINYIPWTVRLSIIGRSCYSYFQKDILFQKNLLSKSNIGQLQDNSCAFIYMSPRGRIRPRTCFTTLSVSLAKKETGSCQNHLNPVIVDFKIIYRNIYCADKWNYLKCDIDGFPYDDGKKSQIYPLTILFTVQLPQFDEESLCSPYNQLDDKTGMCFPNTCEEDTDTCKVRTNDMFIRNYVLKINLLLASDSIIDANISRGALSMFTTCLPHQQYDLMFRPYSSINKTFLYTLDSNINGGVKSVINATFAFVVRKTVNKKTLTNLKLRMEKMELNYTRSSPSIPKENLIKIWRIWNPLDLHLSSEFTNLEWAGSSMTLKYLDSLQNLDDLPILDNIPSKCHIEMVDIRETINGKWRYINNFYFEMENINMSKPSIENNRHNFSKNDNQFAQGLLTYITLSISCGAVVPTIIVHRYLKLVSSTPGMITEQILILSLCFGISFMTGITPKTNYILCFSIAVLTHYLILSFFTWISIFVCHTLKQLRNLKKAHNNSPLNNRQFPKTYFVVGYLGPVFMITPPAIIELCGCTNIKIGYTDFACFPTGYPANLVVVVLPIMLFVLIHLLCLCYAGWCLYRVRNDLPQFGLMTSRSYVSVYIRLCLISGLSWGLGVLSEAMDSDLIRYVFILLSGSHGLIFTLCVVTTKTFRQLFKEHVLTSKSTAQIDMEMVQNDHETQSNNDVPA